MEEKVSRNVDRVKAEVQNTLRGGRYLRVNYVEIVDRDTMRTETEIVPSRSLLVVAVWVDQVRLIDNFSF